MKGVMGMKLYRYELYCNGEPQDVGFIVGLSRVVCNKWCELSDNQLNQLLEPFDTLLKFHRVASEDTVSFFTEHGRDVLYNAINNVADVYIGSEYSVHEVVIDLPDEDEYQIKYEDRYQVYLTIDLYEKLKAERYMMCV